MIAFGCSITIPEVYERCAGPGIRLAAEPDTKVFADAAAGPIAQSYNLILDQAAALDDLEALVLLHQDAEIIDADFAPKLRRALEDPRVGVVGCVGATGVRNIAWWEGRVSASAVYRYGELGGGDLSLNGEGPPTNPVEVETLYGVVLGLSPWSVRNIRFDESLGPRHGYDFDLCAQVRAAGLKVIAYDLGVAHHHSLDVITEPEIWSEAHVATAEKWDGGPAEGAWKHRARRAEAEAAAARLRGASRLLQIYAVAQEQDDELEAITRSASWRLTRPLRRLNTIRKTIRRRGR